MNVEMPDGTMITDVPDGITQSELMRRYRGTTQTEAAGTQAAKDTPAWQVPLVAAGSVFDKVGAGIRQMLPDNVRATLDKANAAMGGSVPPSIDPQTRQQEANYYKQLQNRAPVSTFLGELAPTLAVTNPVGMAALGALQYGTPSERAVQAGLGYAGGKVGQWLGQGVSKVIGGPESATTTPSLASEFFADVPGNKWGIPLTVAQQTQSVPAQITESVLANLPFSAGVIAKSRDRTLGGFNQAVSGMFGDNATKITPDLLGAAQERIGGKIGDISARNSIVMDQPLFQGLQAARQRALDDLGPGNEAQIVIGRIQRIFNSVDPQTGAIPGTLYKAYQSDLGKIAKDRGGTLASVLGDVRAELREAMTRSVSQDDSAAWLKANEQYFNMRQVADATKATPGELIPSRLLSQVNSAQKNAKFGGGNDLAELAQWAKNTLPEKIPNSGTAQRLLYQRVLSNPLTTLGTIGGAGYAADQAGYGKEAAFGIPLAYGLARAMAGKPLSPSTEELLKRFGGGLLGTYALDRQPSNGLLGQ